MIETSKQQTVQIKKYWDQQKIYVDSLALKYTCIQKECKNKNAYYYDITFFSFDGTLIHAKYIRPSHPQKVPVVFDFHDEMMASQGWHHLTRYIALGYAVVAMDCREQCGYGTQFNFNNDDIAIDELYIRKLYPDAYILSRVVEQLEGIDIQKMISFGRGQGAAIALVLATLNQNIKKCSLLYPTLCDIEHASEVASTNMYKDLKEYFRRKDPMHINSDAIYIKLAYIDLLHFIPYLSCELFMGTALMDTTAPADCQMRVFKLATCCKKQVLFPKNEHERINAFENENLKFMKFDIISEG